jgi:hypothetical protein
MAINPALLISAAMLQDYLVDNATGLPLANGTITMYQDNSRTTFKNWYTLSGTAGIYSFVPLPNPMTLSGVGTMQDANGNDIIPYYYPYSEVDNQTPQPYYVVVVNSNGQQQFTRQDFPYVVTSSSPTPISTQRNYLINNVFWRNIGTANLTNVTSMVIAPSQHDGFSMPDIQFIKNTTGATDNITFTKFIPGDEAGQVLVDDITPEYYINFNCSASESGESLKCIQFPISLHIKTLESVASSIVVHGQNVGGNTNNTLTLAIYQFLGTGVTSPSPIILQTLTLNNNWTKFIVPFVFPSASDLTLGDGGDDALYLQIQYPVGVTFEINHTKPQLYLSSTEVPDNDFDTYDDIDAFINSPRTGDLRTSINSFYPYGWVPMNNGTIGNPSSLATTRANQDTWQLFNLFWSIAKPYDSGGNFNQICQMYTMGGSATNFGTSAIIDFNSNNQLALTQSFGRVLMGTVPAAALIAPFTQAVTFSNSGGNLLATVSNATGLYDGQTIAFTTTGTLPNAIFANAVYYITAITSNTFLLSDTFANYVGNSYVAYNSTNGSDCSLVVQPIGSETGEYLHNLLQRELPSVIGGNLTSTSFNYQTGGSTQIAVGGSGSQGVALTISNPSAGFPFNIIQPSTFYNIFIKL